MRIFVTKTNLKLGQWKGVPVRSFEMKKIISVLVLSLVSMCLFAQWIPVPVSLENDATEGTFVNEIDKAFQVTPEAFSQFGTYENQFLHAGLSNPKTLHDMINSKDTMFRGNDFALGYYMPGTLPQSFFFNFGGRAFLINRGGKNVENTWEDNTHKKLLTTKTTEYNAMPVFENSKFLTQYLVGLGNGVATGVYLRFNTYADKLARENYAKVTYKDHTIPENNYKTNRKNIAFDLDTWISNMTNNNTDVEMPDAAGKRRFSVDLMVPFAFSLGDVKNVARIELVSDIQIGNGSLKHSAKDILFDHKIDYKVKDTSTGTNILLGYDVLLPAGREEDYWFAGGNIGLKLSSKSTKKDFSYDGITKVSASEKSNYKTGVNFHMHITGGRLLVFKSPAKTISFRLKPTGGLGFSVGRGGAYNPKTTSNIKVKDLGLDDSSTTEKYDAKPLTSYINASMSLPMGVKILPENWKIGFILGATPIAQVTTTIEQNRNKDGSKTKVTTKTLAGSTTTTTYDSPTANNGVANRIVQFSFMENHDIGLTIPFEGGAHLDISMNGNHLAFIEGFKIQAFIPLSK